MGARFTELKQGPFYRKAEIRIIHTKQAEHVKKTKARKVLMENTILNTRETGFWMRFAAIWLDILIMRLRLFVCSVNCDSQILMVN